MYTTYTVYKNSKEMFVEHSLCQKTSRGELECCRKAVTVPSLRSKWTVDVCMESTDLKYTR